MDDTFFRQEVVSAPMPIDHGRAGYVAVASRPRCASGAAPRLSGKARRASRNETSFALIRTSGRAVRPPIIPGYVWLASALARYCADNRRALPAGLRLREILTRQAAHGSDSQASARWRLSVLKQLYKRVSHNADPRDGGEQCNR
jgi:hypothetical protein